MGVPDFALLELGIWILFDICYLMLGIFYIRGLSYNLGILFDLLIEYVEHNTRVHQGPSGDYNTTALYLLQPL